MVELRLTTDTLVFFVDETGDENTSDPNRPVFGFGGCAVMASSLDLDVRAPWRAVRQAVTGSEATPLHAATLPEGITPEQIDRIGAFFRTGRFARIGVSCSDQTIAPDDVETVQYVLECLKHRMLDILKFSRAQRIAVVFEANQRLEPAIERYFGIPSISEGGREIPVEPCFLAKAAGEPALEVADFTANAIGGHAHFLGTRKGAYRLDFRSIFHGQDTRLTSYLHVNKVALTPSREYQ